MLLNRNLDRSQFWHIDLKLQIFSFEKLTDAVQETHLMTVLLQERTNKLVYETI